MDTSIFYNESSNGFYLLNPITIIIFISPNLILCKTKVCYQSYFREIFYYFFKKGHSVVSFLCLVLLLLGLTTTENYIKLQIIRKQKSPKQRAFSNL